MTRGKEKIVGQHTTEDETNEPEEPSRGTNRTKEEKPPTLTQDQFNQAMNQAIAEVNQLASKKHMLESEIEKGVTAYAISKGWLAYKWVSPGHRGVPDRLYFKNGGIKIVEFKSAGKKPTVMQKLVHQKLEKENFKVDVIDDLCQGKKLFD